MIVRKTWQVANKLKEQSNVSSGDCVLLVYPPGLDFIIAFLACLVAKVIAVPVFPPGKEEKINVSLFNNDI